MDQQSTNQKNCQPELPYKVSVSTSVDPQKYAQLISAIRQKETKVIKSLLESGAPANRCPTFNALQTPLHVAVHVGDLEIVEELISRGASVNAKHSSDTSLTLAAKFEKYDIVDSLLLAQGVKNRCSDEGITHFHIACMRNQVNAVKNLLNYGNVNAAVDSSSDYWPGFTALHFAVQFQSVETVELLLKAGADITLKEERSFTPLHLAHKFRNEKIIDMILLMHEGVLINPTNSKGLSHFHIACTRNNTKIFEHFVKLGVNVGDPIPSKTKSSPMPKTALDLAIQYECADVVKIFLSPGDQMEISRSYHKYLLESAYSTGNIEIINSLSSNVASGNRSFHKPNQQFSDAEKSSASFLSFTIRHLNLFKNLQSQTQSTLDSLVNSNGCTALHLSIRHKHQNISTYLLNRGVDYTIQNIQGKSPLHLAFEQNMEYFVDLMLNNHKKYDKNPTDKDGFSHFHIACAKNNVHTVEHLLKLGADVNASVSLNALFCPGFTPLHFAAKFGSKRVAEILLKHGANFSANDASNLSPFDVAFREANSSKIDGTFDIIKLILTTNNKRKDNSFNDRGFTLVHLASVTCENFQSPLKELNRVIEEFPKYVNKAVDKMNCSWDGFTPLHFAVQDYEYESHVKVLIDNGADVLKQASNGDTPLHLLDAWTAHYFLFFMNFQNLRLLELNYIGSQGRSIFHQACYMGNFRLIKFFLEHGIDANDPSIAYGLGCYSDTPLHLAVSNASEWSIENVKLLLDYKADPTTRNHEGNTPLHLMSDNPFPEIIDMLVNQGANINARNALCETPLLTFCRKTKLKFEYLNKIVESFLKKGADINLADRVNETPLTVFSLKKRISPECHSAVKSLMAHVSKLLSADLFVSKINTNAHSSFINRRAFEVPVYDDYFKELEVMKHVYIDNHTTLYDVLRQSRNKLMRTTRNEKFQQTLKSHDFSTKFPNYYQILTMRFNQGRLRQPLLEQSLANLEALLKVLPKLCIYEILENLENADLENIIKTIER